MANDRYTKGQMVSDTHHLNYKKSGGDTVSPPDFSCERNAVNDETLVSQARGGNTSALDLLMNRFKPLVKSKAKDYFLTGGDLEDLIQEGMIGLYKAVLDFDPAKNVKFSSFATLCVVRQIQTAIKAASRQKHMPLNTSLSLHSEATPETNFDKIPGSRLSNPETLVLGHEAYKDIENFIRENLSDLEYDVLTLHMDGKTHLEISEALGKNLKTVDNALQRIRRKIGKSITSKL